MSVFVKRKVVGVVASTLALFVGSLGAASLVVHAGGAAAADQTVEVGSFEAAFEVPTLAAEDAVAVEKAVADASISKIDVHADSHEVIVSYPNTVASVDEPAEKALERLQKLGGKFAGARLEGITAGFKADWGVVKGFVVHDANAGRPQGPLAKPEWSLWVVVYPLKGHAFNGAGQPDLTIKLKAPEGVKLEQGAGTEGWSLKDGTITDTTGATKAKPYSLEMKVPAEVAKAEFVVQAEVRVVDVPPGKAHAVSLVVPVNKKWYR